MVAAPVSSTRRREFSGLTVRSNPDQPDLRALYDERREACCRTDRRLGERSPRPSSSPSVTSRSARLQFTSEGFGVTGPREASTARCPGYSWMRHPAAEIATACRTGRTTRGR
jgi:hypothetical protein